MAIIVDLYCGLANRMFQYCYYMYLLESGHDATVHYERKFKFAHEVVYWSHIFPKATYKEASRIMDELSGGSLSKQSRFRRKFLPWTCSVRDIRSPYEVPDPTGSKSKCYRGFYQNAEMVEALGRKVFEWFEFPEIRDERNLKYIEEMESSDSVAIHVRKGNDYQELKEFSSTCGIEYYRKAIEYITARIDDPKFFVFTDNPEWVKQNLTGIDYTLIEGNPSSGPDNYLDMQLMSRCKHNIIANSSYSWWGAFLNQNPDKMVLMPEIWLYLGNREPQNSIPLQCKQWTII